MKGGIRIGDQWGLGEAASFSGPGGSLWVPDPTATTPPSLLLPLVLTLQPLRICRSCVCVCWGAGRGLRSIFLRQNFT